MDSEKRLLLAVALSVLIYLVFMWLSPPPAPPARPAPTPTTEAAQAEPVAPPVPEPTPPAEPVDAVAAAEEEEVRVDNGVFSVALTNRGGRARSWALLQFTTPDGEPLDLLPSYARETELPLGIDLDDTNLADALNQALYRVERSEIAAEGGYTGGERVTFAWADGAGLEARKSFEFRRGDYLVSVELEVRDRGRTLPARLKLGPGFAAQENSDGHSNYYYESQAVWNVAGDVSRTRAKKLDEQGGLKGRVRWAGLEDQYFTALVLPGGDEAEVRWRTVEVVPRKAPDAEAEPEAERKPIIATSIPQTGGLLFIGPKKYTLLRELGYDLDKSVWFSSMSWLQPVVKYLFLGLIWIHDRVVQNWGWAIVLATVVLRLVLFPVNQYSMVSMKKTQLQMQRLQPKVKKIREKYRKAKDAQARAKMNQEMMEMYRQEGVNPMGGLSGCLPLLAQFPILIGFYNMLTVAVELRGAPFFGWIRDLSQADPWYITPILMAATMFAQQKLAMSKVKDPQQLQQQRIMLFMPLVFGYFCLWLPSGLVLYWFVNNLLGMGQQWLVNRHTVRLEAAAKKA